MISHDLSVVEHMSDRVAVMYFGQIVETGSWDRVFTDPQHPYTRRLIGAILDPVTELTGQSPVDTRDAPEPPPGYDYYPKEFGKHDVYSLPPASQLMALRNDHSVRLIARG
ncbi:Glutathione import ATP-binding protein GsiA [compost metagenome]